MTGIIAILGDSRDILKTYEENSFDSCVTDPPYALVSIVKRFGGKNAAPAQQGSDGRYARASAGFMGQQWDNGSTAFDPEFWVGVMRVLKPGGHVVAFSGTRTYHRMACAIEDAGFEIRDQIGWAYGSGFPKSHDLSKGIQRRRIEDAEPIRAICRVIRAAMDASDLKSRQLVGHFDGCHPRLIDHWAARDTDSQPALPTWEQWQTLRTVLVISEDYDAEVWRLNGRKGEPGASWTEAEIIGRMEGIAPGLPGGVRFSGDDTIRVPSQEAAEWDGWGTAIKPAWEPICLARKPLSERTVAANVLRWGTGAINVDGCRVETDPAIDDPRLGGAGSWTTTKQQDGHTVSLPRGTVASSAKGRWPANIVHDGSDEVISAFPDSDGQQGDVRGSEPSKPTDQIYGQFGGRVAQAARNDSGSAARFFYTAKADADDRLGSGHPTVKPVDLMQWLCRLITPPGGLILEPFAGTGTTGEAAFREKFRCTMIEREEKFYADILRRIDLMQSGADTRRRESIKAKIESGRLNDDPGPLFGDK